MNKLINTTGIHTVNYIDGRTGSFRTITKCRAGYMTCTNIRPFENDRANENKEVLMTGYKRNTLQAIEFQPEGSNYWLTIFARVGKTIKIIDESILVDLTVGTINGLWDNTNLMCMNQYKAVRAKTWADKAFTMNQIAEVA